MKRILTLITVAAVTTAATTPQNREDAPEITFDKTVHVFGKVSQHSPVTYEFKFTNTGTEPLVVSNVERPCGCTTPGWTRNPVMPAEVGYVSVQFKSKTLGAFSKVVSVVSNATNSPVKLYVQGEVVPRGTDTGTPATDHPLTPGQSN